jgi:hypothetical protein
MFHVKQSEKCLQYLCQQFLVESGLWRRLLIFHVPNERRGGVGAGIHFKRMGVRPGVADYLVFGGMRDAAIELKDEDGKQNEAQKEFQRRWEATGKVYFVVRTLEEFQEIMDGIALFAKTETPSKCSRRS